MPASRRLREKWPGVASLPLPIQRAAWTSPRRGAFCTLRTGHSPARCRTHAGGAIRVLPAARSRCCRPCVPYSAAAAAPCTWAPRAARGRTSRRWVASRRRLLLGASERFPSLSSVFLGSVGFPGRAKSSQAAGLPGVFGVFFKAAFQGLCVFPHSNACGGLRFCPPVRSGVGGSSVYLLPRDREADPAACHMLVVLGSFSRGGGVATNAKRVFPPNSQVQPTPPTGGLGGGASESRPRPFRPAT